MSYEMYEVMKQYRFEVYGLGPVKAEIVKTIQPQINNPYYWRCNYIYDGYAPNHGNSLELAEEELKFYIENFDVPSAELDPDY